MVKKATKEETPKSALSKLITDIDDKFGKGTASFLGAVDRSVIPIPSGSLALDLVLGVGGIPRGRIIEIYGNPQGGKSTLALHIVAEAQRAGGSAAFIDVEHAMDPNYAESVGVNVNELFFSQPDDGEVALDIVDYLVDSQKVDVIVVDSVAGLVTKREMEGASGDNHVALQSRLMSQALKKLSAKCGQKSKTAIIFINQTRMKINTMPGESPYTTSGGRALLFYTSIRVEVNTLQAIKDTAGQQIGARVKFFVFKNKVAPPKRKAEAVIIFGKGIDKGQDAFDTAVTMGLITRKGNTYFWHDAELATGRDAAIKAILGNKAAFEGIVEEVKNNILSYRTLSDDEPDSPEPDAEDEGDE